VRLILVLVLVLVHSLVPLILLRRGIATAESSIIISSSSIIVFFGARRRWSPARPISFAVREHWRRID
jgi:preprotein translocase subunit SecG